jgi:hypothetical protein
MKGKGDPTEYFNEATMNVWQVLVRGTVKPDGTLELIEAPNLPPGPVEVLIRNQVTGEEGKESWWEFLERNRAELVSAGHGFRDKEAIDADLASRRSSDESRRQSLKRLQKPDA